MVLKVEPDLDVCGTATTLGDALCLFKTFEPDMAIVDQQLGGHSGLDLVHDLLAEDRRFPILMYSMHEEAHYAERAIRAGARGYASKQEDASRLIAAIRTIRNGGVYLSKRLAQQSLRDRTQAVSAVDASDLSNLTNQELQVMQLMGHDVTRGEIASQMSVSVKTLDGYRRNIVRKLGLRDVTHLAQWAARLDERGKI